MSFPSRLRLAVASCAPSLVCVFGLLSPAAYAQAAPAVTSPIVQDAPQTLHLYTDLMQVPTLVLSAQREPMKPVDPARFRVSLDRGPAFQPAHVHREADDPLSLALLLDTSSDPQGMVPNLEAAFAALPPTTWTANDRVDVYVLDCTLVHRATALDPGKGGLPAAVHDGLASWKGRTGRILTKPCAQTTPLADAISGVVGEMARRDGRRVMMVLSQSKGDGGQTTWRTVTDRAHLSGVAIFGITGPKELARAQTPGNLRPTQAAQQGLVFADNADNGLQLACEFSGGVSQPSGTSKSSLVKTFARVVEMVRGRYVIEFPRPANGTEGMHSIEITVTGSDAYVRPAGIVVPLRDGVQQGTPSNAPLQGGKP